MITIQINEEDSLIYVNKIIDGQIIRQRISILDRPLYPKDVIDEYRWIKNIE